MDVTLVEVEVEAEMEMETEQDQKLNKLEKAQGAEGVMSRISYH